ncbi:hypothetical protein BIFGAL_04063 [Bifidobacterium gallicum DSM 20093 = LMG 11596]|uniref:Uncharacterized protein n=1 Tax=Bifidobacterium gallicum DSM 20093 = LMG 11596 TaxID=561180 RepID=D1NW18_9BIFI|nr:hypothetical protein BIFGAL_04063 [Bifidobacterium gallicum DSM 20093 = LMG 11596]
MIPTCVFPDQPGQGSGACGPETASPLTSLVRGVAFFGLELQFC